MIGGADISAQDLAQAFGELVFELSSTGQCARALGGADPEGLWHALAGRSLRDVIAVRDVEPVMQMLGRVQRDGGSATIECRLPRGSAARFHELRVARARDGGLVACLRDVDRRLQSEHGLRESEALFRVMADDAPVLLWKAGLDAECDFFNRGWLEFTGRPLERELGVGWAAGVHPEDFQSAMETYLDAFVARRPFRMEYRLRRADGAYRFILDHGAPRFGEDGAFAGFIGSCIDITDGKLGELEVRRLNLALQTRVVEREALLREIHHRVKNNLQLISSILSLQARLLKGEARALIEEGQLRVRSMAMVHEKLCESHSLAEVDLVDYTRDLVRALLHAIGNGSVREVRVEGDALPIAADQAVPCGLVIAELVTNALKHAFPEGRPGSVVIAFEPHAGERLRLVVRDDGVGLPRALDLRRPTTLGLELVNTLARQLNAVLAHRDGPGTHLELDIPVTRSRDAH